MNDVEKKVVDLYNKYKENKGKKTEVTLPVEEVVEITEFALSIRDEYLAMRQALEKEIDYSRLLKLENNSLRGGK